jgi:hypothetical protein
MSHCPDPATDTIFPAQPIIDRLNAGEISPEEAARQIVVLRQEDPSPPPVRLPPESFFSRLPEDERQKAREVFRILLSWPHA